MLTAEYERWMRIKRHDCTLPFILAGNLFCCSNDLLMTFMYTVKKTECERHWLKLVFLFFMRMMKHNNFHTLTPVFLSVWHYFDRFDFPFFFWMNLINGKQFIV